MSDDAMQIGLFDNDPVKIEYDELVKVMNYHCDRYYNDDEPEISDYEYDQMNLRLKQIEKEHPEFVRRILPLRDSDGRQRREYSLSITFPC